LSQLINIAEGWFDFIQGTPYTKELMRFRLAICDNCPQKKQMSALGKFLVSTVNNEASLFKCAKCNCLLASKTAAPGSKCPLGKWDIAGTETQLAMY